MHRYLFLAFIAACDGPATPETDVDADTDTDTDTDTDSDADTDTCGPLACTAGVGIDGFSALSGTGEIEMFHGQQGGWHVDTAVRVTTTSPIVRVLPKVFVDGTGEQLSGGDGLQDTYNQALVPDGECHGSTWQMRSIFDIPAGLDLDYICGLEGATLRIELEVTDDELQTVTCAGTGTATLHVDDIDYCGAL